MKNIIHRHSPVNGLGAFTQAHGIKLKHLQNLTTLNPKRWMGRPSPRMLFRATAVTFCMASLNLAAEESTEGEAAVSQDAAKARAVHRQAPNMGDPQAQHPYTEMKVLQSEVNSRRDKLEALAEKDLGRPLARGEFNDWIQTAREESPEVSRLVIEMERYNRLFSQRFRHMPGDTVDEQAVETSRSPEAEARQTEEAQRRQELFEKATHIVQMQNELDQEKDVLNEAQIAERKTKIAQANEALWATLSNTNLPNGDKQTLIQETGNE